MQYERAQSGRQLFAQDVDGDVGDICNAYVEFLEWSADEAASERLVNVYLYIHQFELFELACVREHVAEDARIV